MLVGQIHKKCLVCVICNVNKYEMDHLRPTGVLIEEDVNNKNTFSFQFSLWAEWWMKSPAGTLSHKHQSEVQRWTQWFAPTPSTVPALNWKHTGSSDHQYSLRNLNAWLCGVCSMNPNSDSDCEYQRSSSRMNCGCSSCRMSNYGCGSDFYSDCCCGWRCCSKMKRWMNGCWRKDWAESTGWVAFWHCEEPKKVKVVKEVNLKYIYSDKPWRYDAQ